MSYVFWKYSSLHFCVTFCCCDDICMCVVNKQFEFLEFVLIPFMLPCNIMRFLPLLLLGLCLCVVSVVMLLSFICL